ncbi:MAG: integrase [Angustibacter sp.]
MDSYPALAAAGAAERVEVDEARVPAWQDAWEALAPNTRRAYRHDWAAWTRWATQDDRRVLPASVLDVAAYVRELAATIDEAGQPVVGIAALARRVAAIAFVHRAAGHSSPTGHPDVRGALTAARRRRARTERRPARRATALTLNPLGRVLAAIDTTSWPAAVIGRRDAAMLLLGWMIATRRSELAALRRCDVVLTPGQGRVTIVASKTDQDAEGVTVVLPPAAGVARCAPCAVWRWLDLVTAHDRSAGGAAGRVAAAVFADEGGAHVCARHGAWNDETPLLRAVTKTGAIGPAGISGETVHRRLRHHADAAGLDLPGLTGHSLRAGFVSEALAQGLDPHHVMRQTRHTSLATLRLYARHDAPETANAAMELRL